ncbi:MAG: hypothetical protein ABH824_04675 [Nanoarchaeota archaeon]|nr:hypothetical protein [Nanoarchaeota archaeon]MBU1632711.1 hypothetical protein [Nanoarchaeota archaeon]MBU1875599.1 hypothetical protein [Nanoarchaeota archaeon]
MTGLHDTYFLRAKHFADISKSVESESSLILKDTNNEYFNMRQRGHLLGAAEVGGYKGISSLLDGSKSLRSTYNVDGKTDIASKLGYTTLKIPLNIYSGGGSNYSGLSHSSSSSAYISN